MPHCEFRKNFVIVEPIEEDCILLLSQLLYGWISIDDSFH